MDGARRVFLDPDGTIELGLLVIVMDRTGVVYSHQCAGLINEIREVEGFIVPVGGPTEARALSEWFNRNFCGNVPGSFSASDGDYFASWTPDLLGELQGFVEQISYWTTSGGQDQRSFLTLDLENIEEVTEGWVPVMTPEGRGILIFENSD